MEHKQGDESTAVTRRSFIAMAAIGAAVPLAFVSTRATSESATELATWSIQEAAEQSRRRRISPVDLTNACLDRIEHLIPSLNAFITVTAESALAAAREAEAEIQRGRWRGPLHGIPIALKDLFDTAGIRTTAASGVFKDRVPAEDANVVVRLKQGGAVLVGKVNLHEFALGGTSAVTYFGPVRNPWALDRVAG